MPLRGEGLRTTDVIDVVRVAAVDQRVAALEKRQQFGADLVDERDRHHEPQRARLLQFRDQVPQRGRAGGAFFHQASTACGSHIEHDALVPALQQTAHHVGAHSSQTDHSELHDSLTLWLASSPSRATSSSTAMTPSSSFQEVEKAAAPSSCSFAASASRRRPRCRSLRARARSRRRRSRARRRAHRGPRTP